MAKEKKYAGTRVLVLEGYCKQTLPYLRAFRAEGCEVSVLCNSRLDCAYLSRLPHHRIIDICDPHKPEESEQTISRLIKSEKYDIIFSPFDFSSEILSRRKKEFSKFAKICVNDADTYAAGANKETVMRACMENDIPCPRTYFNVSTPDDLVALAPVFPIIVKPKSMYGARGFHILNSIEEVRDYFADGSRKLSEYVIQEQILPGSLVLSCTLYIDRHGQVKSDFIYVSEHIYPEDGGTSTLNGILVRPDISADCRRLVSLMGLKGIVSVDLMLDPRDDKGKVIEINVRSPHAVEIGFLQGINLARQLLQDAAGDEVEEMKLVNRNICLRIGQTDLLWWITSKDRFRRRPSRLGYKSVHEQMFYIDDPLPWFGFLLSGLLEFKKKMAEKRQ